MASFPRRVVRYRYAFIWLRAMSRLHVSFCFISVTIMANAVSLELLITSTDFAK